MGYRGRIPVESQGQLGEVIGTDRKTVEVLKKLRREDQYNSETIAAARARQKSFGRVVKEAMSTKTRYKRGYED